VGRGRRDVVSGGQEDDVSEGPVVMPTKSVYVYASGPYVSQGKETTKLTHNPGSSCNV
jgi:hypothetical protein